MSGDPDSAVIPPPRLKPADTYLSPTDWHGAPENVDMSGVGYECWWTRLNWDGYIPVVAAETPEAVMAAARRLLDECRQRDEQRR